MGLWQRFTTVFKAKANKAIDRMEDPRETLDYSYERQLEMLQKVKRGLLDVATSRKRLELQGEQLQAKAAKLHEQAKRAMEADREDLAREALTRRAAIEPELESLRAQHAQLQAEGYLRRMADLNWNIAGVGDFNGDGKDDILWRNTSTGENYIYLMNGLTIARPGSINSVSDQAWQVNGIGDFDGDGKADILWRNSSTGENYIWRMNGLSTASQGSVNFVDPASGWQVQR